MTSNFPIVVRRAWLGVGLAALVGCGGGAPVADGAASDATADQLATQDSAPSADAGPEATVDAAVDAAVDAPFMTAAHAPLLHVDTLGGRVLTSPQVVTVTYADDPQRAPIDAFVQSLVHSSWMHAAVGEYGVGEGTVLGVQHRTDNAPTMFTSVQLEAQLAADVRSGALPVPADHDVSNLIYMVFLPGTSTITLPSGAASCTQFTGYHGEFASPYGAVSYAAVVNCGSAQFGTPEGDYTYPGSHELAEAITDALPRTHPGYRVPADSASAWLAFGAELADLCFFDPPYQSPDGTVLAPSWSNVAAAAGGNPCVPAVAGENFFSVDVGPDALQTVDAGQTVTFTLRGWSQRPMSAWHLELYPLGGDATLRARLGATTLNNGLTTTVTVMAPATIASGAFGKWALLLTSATTHHAVPLVVAVP